MGVRRGILPADTAVCAVDTVCVRAGSRVRVPSAGRAPYAATGTGGLCSELTQSGAGRGIAPLPRVYAEHAEDGGAVEHRHDRRPRRRPKHHLRGRVTVTLSLAPLGHSPHSVTRPTRSLAPSGRVGATPSRTSLRPLAPAPPPTRPHPTPPHPPIHAHGPGPSRQHDRGRRAGGCSMTGGGGRGCAAWQGGAGGGVQGNLLAGLGEAQAADHHHPVHRQPPRCPPLTPHRSLHLLPPHLPTPGPAAPVPC